ncbi:histone-fold-containing protein [Microstroma glucosiphilum]|uniref:Histone-fold-containing protein n=1 Tax=Pseudomicrostroma glucosiphilum TaxID=1684307 RepID=A0A316UD42_9BASI|nr:histone-fold-containing protein [Pseudomicrostroma glucosiphilum]PWN22331.1 histone-fold-containing protein [Pseudomicrostroma glucosiphilum]
MSTSALEEKPFVTMASSTSTPSTQLPLSNISRLMKASLPASSPSLKLSSPTKTMMQDIVSEFILFVTAEAQERAEAQRRSTLNGDDVLYALEVLGFRDYERVGKVWLSRYRIATQQNDHAASSRASGKRSRSDEGDDTSKTSKASRKS